MNKGVLDNKIVLIYFNALKTLGFLKTMSLPCCQIHFVYYELSTKQICDISGWFRMVFDVWMCCVTLVGNGVYIVSLV